MGFESILENFFVMVLVSIRTYTKFCFEKWFKDVFVNRVLKSVFEKRFCNSSRLYKNVYKMFCLLKMFLNESVGVKMFLS